MTHRDLKPVKKIFYAIKELGLMPVFQNGMYRFAKSSGILQVISKPKNPVQKTRLTKISPVCPLNLISRDSIVNRYGGSPDEILFEAEQVRIGYFRAYGGGFKALNFQTDDHHKHWSRCEEDRGDGTDIKDTWEPARFSWVFPLIRAFQFDHNIEYALAFKKYFEAFTRINPPFLGSNWASGQEAAIRLIAMVCGYQTFQSVLTSDESFITLFTRSVYHHAQRIPSTLIYARSQRNNHLLSEAAGLYSAGVFLDGCQEAKHWRRLGWRIFHQALADQIDADGEYIQHSTNYHRLMLQLALWMLRLGNAVGDEFPSGSSSALSAATAWYWARIDVGSGHALNLGHNDGSNLFPLGHQDYRDHRATLQAAGLAFLNAKPLPSGQWDELSAWLGVADRVPLNNMQAPMNAAPDQRIMAGNCWGILRTPRYVSRPAHADLLHFDLWINGLNALMDAGTYRYTAKAPWRNALAGSAPHNTLIIDGSDQMTRAGRFLWLEWASAEVIRNEPVSSARASHNGYANINCIHPREVTIIQDGCWKIRDDILPLKQTRQNHRFRLHWLMPDGDWNLDGSTFVLKLPQITLSLEMILPDQGNTAAQIAVIRSGVCMTGKTEGYEILGYHSTLYGQLEPATSIVFEWESVIPTGVETTVRYSLTTG